MNLTCSTTKFKYLVLCKRLLGEKLNRKRRILSTIIIVALISTAILTLSTPKAKANPETKLQILPATNTFNVYTKPPGTIITLNITVANVTDLFTWQVAVHWDPTLLNYSNIFLPSDHVFAGETIYPMGPDISYTEGTVIYAVALGAGMETFNGTGTLCQLNLTLLAPASFPASCNIEFIHYPPYTPSDTFLLDSLGIDIEFTPESATYNYSSEMVPERVIHSLTYLGITYTLETYSNASIAQNSIGINGTAKMILFNATSSGEAAFVNVTIPKALLNASIAEWKVYVNGTQLLAGNIQVSENSTHTFIYMEFPTSLTTIGVQGTWIVPELSNAFMFLTIAASSLVVAKLKIRARKK